MMKKTTEKYKLTQTTEWFNPSRYFTLFVTDFAPIGNLQIMACFYYICNISLRVNLEK